ncbi:hypothetical protein MHM93_15440 [Pseudoalteromonas sp. MM17-2]|uniref:hypothetical protein n=1 Tax=Pseudoalteromonas TaxID=53246 RepID=UPI001EF62E39|nr:MULTISPECIES: hypothetical protein [Pseudoalteromonas]MCG7545575.1 hypothetical protein [Pseudoalteromonas sp. MM17-2]|tara:strand:- start:16921 stop:17292 length:372 start_codon:yes stop_codon:yes gene_type:complete
MGTVNISLTGEAVVQVRRDIQVDEAEAQAILADDKAIQTLLNQGQSLAVKSWQMVSGLKAKPVASKPKAEPGYSCANHYCGWVGHEFEKKLIPDPADANKQLKACPKCNFLSFNKFQAITPRN